MKPSSSPLVSNSHLGSPLLKYTVLAGSSPDQITTPLVTGLASGGDVTTCTCPMSGSSQYYRIQVGP